ncbi:MAG: hypothetical protein ACTSYR_02470 [Candidatus Odinarchaeia archaeon]
MPMVIDFIIESFNIASFLILFGPSVIEFLTLIIFIYALLLPLSNTLRDIQIGPLEIVISTPVKPQHILMGIFLGRMFNYGILIVMLGAPLISLLIIGYNASIVYILVTVVVLIILFLLSNWIGTLIATVLQSKLTKISKGREIGRAITFVVALIIFLVFYGFLNLIQIFESNTFINSIIQFIPSSWAANIISSLIIGAASVIPPYLSAILLTGSTLIALILGYKIAGRLFSLEPSQPYSQTIVKENFIFSLLKRIFPGGYGVVISVQLKDFTRRMENIAKIAYAVVITIFVTVIQFTSSSSMPYDFTVFFSALFFAHIIILLLGSDFFIKGKDKLWIFKKAPSGITKLIIGKIMQLNITVFPIALFTSILSVIIYGLPLAIIPLSIGLTFFYTFVFSLLIVGISSINPAFTERSYKYAINMMVYLVIIWGLYVLSILLVAFLPNIFGTNIVLNTVYFYILTSMIFTLLGKKRIEKLE